MYAYCSTTFHITPMPTLAITTLTNKTLTFEGCDPSLKLLGAQEKYQDREGVDPKGQRLWFPVVGGGRPATDFVWWKDTAAKLPAELKERLLASPLKQWEDETTLGEIADLQGAGDSAVNCFIVLQLAKLPAGEDDGTGMKDVQAEKLEQQKDKLVGNIEDASDDEEQTEHLTKAFAVFDVDKNGKLSRQELKDILTRMENKDNRVRKIDEEEADEIIDEFIKKNDGKELSVEEYIKVMRKFVPVR